MVSFSSLPQRGRFASELSFLDLESPFSVTPECKLGSFKMEQSFEDIEDAYFQQHEVNDSDSFSDSSTDSVSRRNAEMLARRQQEILLAEKQKRKLQRKKNRHRLDAAIDDSMSDTSVASSPPGRHFPMKRKQMDQKVPQHSFVPQPESGSDSDSSLSSSSTDDQDDGFHGGAHQKHKKRKKSKEKWRPISREEAEAKMRQQGLTQPMHRAAAPVPSPSSMGAISYGSFPVGATQAHHFSASASMASSASALTPTNPYRLPLNASPFTRSKGPPAGIKLHPSRMAQFSKQFSPEAAAAAAGTETTINPHINASSPHLEEAETEPSVVRQRIGDPLDNRHWLNSPCQFSEIHDKAQFQIWKTWVTAPWRKMAKRRQHCHRINNGSKQRRFFQKTRRVRPRTSANDLIDLVPPPSDLSGDVFSPLVIREADPSKQPKQPKPQRSTSSSSSSSSLASSKKVSPRNPQQIPSLSLDMSQSQEPFSDLISLNDPSFHDHDRASSVSHETPVICLDDTDDDDGIIPEFSTGNALRLHPPSSSSIQEQIRSYQSNLHHPTVTINASHHNSVNNGAAASYGDQFLSFQFQHQQQQQHQQEPQRYHHHPTAATGLQQLGGGGGTLTPSSYLFDQQRRFREVY